MRKSLTLGALGLAALVTAGCSGSGGSTPTGPSAPGSPAAVIIAIMGDRGAASFDPNPANAPRGTMVAWRNTDTVVHRIRFNDGSLQTQDIAPGQTSAAMAMPSDGANYHCPLHPGMIGAFAGSSGAPPECDDPLYC